MDQHQIVAYIYIGLSILYTLCAIYLVKWVRNEREKMFHDVNKLIGDSFGYHKKKKVKYFKVLSPREMEEASPEAQEEAVCMYADADLPVAEEEVIDDECPTKVDLDPIQ